MLYLVFQFFKDFLMWKGALIKQKAKTLWGLSCCVPSVLTGLLGYHKQASWPTALEHTTHQRCSGVLAVHVQGINKSQNLFSNPYFRSSFEKYIYIFFFQWRWHMSLSIPPIDDNRSTYSSTASSPIKKHINYSSPYNLSRPPPSPCLGERLVTNN